MGFQARLISQALRKLAGSLSKSNTTCIFINQLQKIGVMFGNPETPARAAAPFVLLFQVRIDVAASTALSFGKVIGNRVRAKVVKNKVAAPFRLLSSTSCTYGHL